jgi:oligoribonuclease
MNDTDKSGCFLWFDTEFTSLDLEEAHLLQVALVATDGSLQRVLPPEEDLTAHVRLGEGVVVSPWAEENLADVLRGCRAGDALSVEDADRLLVAYVEKAFGKIPSAESLRPVLAGNSVHSDWFLARRLLPGFSACLHYRHLDVSSLKLEWLGWFGGEEFDKAQPELLRQYAPGGGAGLEGQPHDALYDVLASMAELNYYRRHLVRGEGREA